MSDTDQAEEAQRLNDIATVALKLKKAQNDFYKSSIPQLSKSSSDVDRAHAAMRQKNLDDDTAGMYMTGDRIGRRIGPDGKPTGPEMYKLDDGTYAPAKGKKKGGTIKAPSRTSASKRADGIASKGHTKGRYL